MKTYRTFKEIDFELKRLKLERQIGVEKLKGTKREFADGLKSHHWIGTISKYAWKYGMFMILKKVFR